MYITYTLHKMAPKLSARISESVYCSHVSSRYKQLALPHLTEKFKLEAIV